MICKSFSLLIFMQSRYQGNCGFIKLGNVSSVSILQNLRSTNAKSFLKFLQNSVLNPFGSGFLLVGRLLINASISRGDVGLFKSLFVCDSALVCCINQEISRFFQIFHFGRVQFFLIFFSFLISLIWIFYPHILVNS